VRLMSSNPRRIVHLPERTLEVGQPADIVLVNPREEWTVEPEKLHSRSKNTVFKGMTLRGRVRKVLVGGAVCFEAD
jgi:dihydroorotase